MLCCETTYTASANATASTIANNGETVTASSLATASSTLSVSDAYNTALSIANSVAKSTAQTDANILNQSFLKTIALGKNYTLADNSNYYYIKGDSTTNNSPTFFSLSDDVNIYTSAVDSKGNLYVGGSFNTIKNVNGLTSSDNLTTVFNNVAMWNGKTWSVLGYGLLSISSDFSSSKVISSSIVSVNSICIDDNDNVYFGGIFNAIPDYSNNTVMYANNIAKWNGSAWSVLGTSSENGTNDDVNAIAIDSNNNVYIGGIFTLVNYDGTSGTSANNIAKWNGSVWSVLGTSSENGTNSNINAIAIDSNNNIYVGGIFRFVNYNGTSGTSANRIAKWNGSAWSVLGTSSENGTNNTVNVIAIDSNNNVYIGGDLTLVNYDDTYSTGTFANYIVKWIPSTSSWSILGQDYTVLGNGTSSTVLAIAIDSGNNVYVTGSFDITYNSSTLFVWCYSIAVWTNNNSWSSIGGPNGQTINGIYKQNFSFLNNNIPIAIYKPTTTIYVGADTTIYKLCSDYINISYNGTIVSQLFQNGQIINAYTSNNNGNKICTIVTPSSIIQNYF